MSKIRWIAWAAFACVLVVLGSWIYEAQPREPRWQTAHQPLTPNDEKMWRRSVHFAPDGKTLITHAGGRYAFASVNDDESDVLEPAKVAVWDRATGNKLASYPKSGSFTDVPIFSKDYRYCVSDSRNDAGECFITIVDVREGKETNVPINEKPYSNYQFSPEADIIVQHDVLQNDDEATPLTIYETASGKVLDERKSFGVIAFSNDYLLHVVDWKEARNAVELWSRSARKAVATLSKNGWFAEDLSPDGRSLVVRKFGESGEVIGRAHWNLTSREFAVQPNPWRHDANSPDRKWLLAWELSGDYCLRDAETGRKHGSVAWGGMLPLQPLFSPDGRFVILPFGEDLNIRFPNDMTMRPPFMRPYAIEVLAVPSLNAVWKEAAGDFCQDFAIGHDGKTIYAALKTKTAVTAFELESGDTRAFIDMECVGPTSMKSTADRRFLLIHRTKGKIAAPAPRSISGRVIHWISSWFPQAPSQSLETIVVYDTASQCERFRLTGWECIGAWLSDDAPTLITTHDEGDCTVMRCWDVGWKPLHWAIGIPAAIGGAVVALLTGYRRLRRNQRRWT